MKFTDLNNNVYNIEDIEKCELRKELIEDYHGNKLEKQTYYAILKTGKEIPFQYFNYKRYLKDSQKITE